jgi:ubiquitin-activating enzyme E1
MTKRGLETEGSSNEPKKQKTMNNGTAAQGGAEIDEDLHSRQLAVYGRESMRRLMQANVLIVGALGLGVETGEQD